MARPKPLTLKKIIEDTNTEPEYALLTIWEHGLSYLTDLDSLVRADDVRRVQKMLGIPCAREIGSTDYWCKALTITREELGAKLSQHGLQLGLRQRTLPQGAIRILKRIEVNDGREHSHFSPGDRPFDEHIKDGSFRANFDDITPFEWERIGHECELKYLSEEQVLAVHNALVADFRNSADPIEPSGPRSKELLASAVFRPHTSIGDELKYPTIEMAAAALMHSIVHDHPFHNGNKRTALVSLLAFLDENGYMVTCHEDALFKFVLQVAKHGLVDRSLSVLPDREVISMAKWINNEARQIGYGERTLRTHKLKRILSSFGCEFEYGNTGSKMKIWRSVERKGTLWRRTTDLQTQVYYGGDGKEIDRATIGRIRAELQLDDLHGIDSSSFYDDEPTPVDEFIVRYSKTLKRLARL